MNVHSYLVGLKQQPLFLWMFISVIMNKQFKNKNSSAGDYFPG